jgi:mono/diheme cytochrome c family protein
MTFLATAAFALLILTAHQSYAQDPQVERGRAFAQSNCASCHAIGTSGDSPLPEIESVDGKLGTGCLPAELERDRVGPGPKGAGEQPVIGSAHQQG